MPDFEEPAWAKDIPSGEFISHSTSYKVGKYFDSSEYQKAIGYRWHANVQHCLCNQLIVQYMRSQVRLQKF